MLVTEQRDGGKVFIVTLQGEVTAGDFSTFNETVNESIAEHGVVPNLVIHTSSLPHWKDFDALSAHFKFVREHQKIVKKVAIVTDSGFLSMLRPLVDHFVGAKIRRFPEAALDDAIAWAASSDDHPGSLEIMEGFPDDVVALSAKGIITSQDYRDTLVPLVEEKLKSHQKLKCLFYAGDGFDSYSAGAVWDDMRFGLGHFTTFLKIAIVSDVEWLRHGAKLFGPLMPTELMVFHNSELEDAKTWIAS